MAEAIEVQLNKALKQVEYFRIQTIRLHQQLHECQDWEQVYQDWIGSLQIMGSYSNLEEYVRDRIVQDKHPRR